MVARRSRTGLPPHAERVGLAFDAAAAESHEGRCAIDLTVRLLAREWPCMAIIDLTGRHKTLADSLGSLACSINPHVRLTGPPADGRLTLVVGETAVGLSGPAFYLGSRGWVARFSPDEPVGSGATSNPFGAAIAACVGVANAFRVACAGVQHDSTSSHVDGTVDLSVFDYSRGANAADPELPGVDLGTTHLLGLDGIGGAALWALARVAEISGTLHLIDRDTVEPVSLRRHVLVGRTDIGIARVHVGAAALAATALDTRVHPVSWAEYVSERDDWILQRVAVAAGSARERAAVQASLPRVVLNAWTQREGVGVSRHADFLRAPCLACLYGPRRKEPSMAELVATGIGLPDAQPEIQDMLYYARKVERPLLERVAAATGVHVASLLPFIGTTADVFYRRTVGGGLLGPTGPPDPTGPYSATAFQAAFAGVLLAAEVVIDAALQRPPLPALTRIDPMHPLAERLTVPAPRDPYGRCICGDADYREVYARKYHS